jgi:competence protein ComEA
MTETQIVPTPSPPPQETPRAVAAGLGVLLLAAVLYLGLHFYQAPALSGGEGAALEGATPPRQRIKVYVVGEVRNPGVVALPPDSRVEDAVRQAGGLTERADRMAINLAARVKDEEKIVVPSLGEQGSPPEGELTPPAAEEGPPPETPAGEPTEEVMVEPGVEGSPPPGPGAGPAGGNGEVVVEELPGGRKVSINQATVEELERVPGLGPTLAQAIVDYRRSGRAFSTVEDLLKVPGIGPKTLEKIKPYIDL